MRKKDPKRKKISLKDLPLRIDEVIEEVKENIELGNKTLKKVEEPTLAWALVKQHLHLLQCIQLLYILVKRNTNELNSIHNSIDKLPKKKEFENIKKDLKNQVRESLTPIQEAFDKVKSQKMDYGYIR